MNSHNDPGVFYGQLADWYDLMIGWQARLGREIPPLTAFLRGHGVKRVLDVACGSGQTAWALSQRGFDVTGVDLSDAMLERAKLFSLEGVTAPRFLRWNPAECVYPEKESVFDVALCLGNTFPHLLSDTEALHFLRNLRAVIPGGLLLLQLRNLGHPQMRENPQFAEKDVEKDGRKYTIIRRYDYSESKHGMVGFEWEVKDDAARVVQYSRTYLRIYSNRDLVELLDKAGYTPPIFATPGEDIPLPGAITDYVLWTRALKEI
jgi:glycine/sarcosine N-methyltransferase